ncbi:MAG: Panacea domain-containing protein [Pseudomonadota bacterium]
MQFDRLKLAELVLYACQSCSKEQLGATKLHKVLYYTDMLRFAATGNSVTGSTYSRKPFGPTCDQLLATLHGLEEAGELEVSSEDYFGFTKKSYYPKRDPDVARFSKSELALIDEIIDFVCVKNTAKQISEFSHDLPWQLVNDGDRITYESIFLIFAEDASLTTRSWAEAEAARIETEKSKGHSVESNDVEGFRNRVLQACGG